MHVVKATLLLTSCYLNVNFFRAAHYITPGTVIAFIRGFSAHIPIHAGLRFRATYSRNFYHYLYIGINGFKNVTYDDNGYSICSFYYNPYKTTQLTVKIAATTILSVGLGWLLDAYPQRNIISQKQLLCQFAVVSIIGQTVGSIIKAYSLGS